MFIFYMLTLEIVEVLRNTFGNYVKKTQNHMLMNKTNYYFANTSFCTILQSKEKQIRDYITLILFF